MKFTLGWNLGEIWDMGDTHQDTHPESLRFNTWKTQSLSLNSQKESLLTADDGCHSFEDLLNYEYDK